MNNLEALMRMKPRRPDELDFERAEQFAEAFAAWNRNLRAWLDAVSEAREELMRARMPGRDDGSSGFLIPRGWRIDSDGRMVPIEGAERIE